MYTAPQKQFQTRKEEDILADIARVAQHYPDVRRIFLADGDAMVLSSRRLLNILQAIKQSFPQLQRVSSYCLPRNVRNKSVDELKEIKDAGLSLVYVGAESGDDELLNMINKGETLSSTVTSLNKLNNAGIKSSVMLLNGLGGVMFSEQHAKHSAQLVNDTQPHYLATLVVSFPMGQQRFLSHFPEGFQLLDQSGLFREMEMLIEQTHLKNTIFRSDHASNYLVLKGVLGKDKPSMLEKLRLALNNPELANLRPEWSRGL